MVLPKQLAQCRAKELEHVCRREMQGYCGLEAGADTQGKAEAEGCLTGTRSYDFWTTKYKMVSTGGIHTLLLKS